MPTPQEIRKMRLENDYNEMIRLRAGNIISWKAKLGVVPYIEKYELTINIRTIIWDGSPKYRDQNVVNLTIPPDYPKDPPTILMLTKPGPYHPNWHKEMLWCCGTWNPSESLGEYVIRMVKTLQFDSEITSANDAADADAKSWYRQNLNSGLFPCDKQVLPDPKGIF